MSPSSRRFILAGFGMLVLALLLAIPSSISHPQQEAGAPGASPMIPQEPPPVANLSDTLTPQQDTCLHCHVSGADEHIQTPPLRWMVFSIAGILLMFGTYRAASVWTTRERWKPLSHRAGGWLDSRYNLADPLQKILGKPVPKYAMRWWYCLGGITAFLFVVQAATGIMLAFYYKPTPDEAYASIQFIENEVRFGSSIRAIHHWAANGMVIMCFAHMARVFINGAYKNPRELNWIGGMLLLLATLGFGFTGYLLPWDQRAYWATTVGTDIAGSIPVIGEASLVFLRVGWDVNALTLSRFYTMHVILLPIFTVFLMGLHFMMVRRLGIAKPL